MGRAPRPLPVTRNPLPVTRPLLSLQHLSARVGDFELRDVSFDVPAGAYGVVIGPAGSGKTTLLETIAGVVPRRAGKVILAGDPDGVPRDVSTHQ